MPAHQVALAGAFATGLALLLMSPRPDVAGVRAGGLLVAPVVLGALVVGVVMVNHRGQGIELLAALRAPRAAVTAVLTVVVAFVMTDYVAVRVLPFLHRLTSRTPLPPRVRQEVAMLLPLGALTVAILLVLQQAGSLAQIRDRDEPVEVLDEIALPGHPMGMAFSGDSEGYLSFGEGQIARFALRREGPEYELDLTTVGEGLDYPRGLALADDTLYVAELGPLPCEEDFPRCKAENVPGSEWPEGEVEILDRSRGRVLAFPVQPDGTLGEATPVLDDLPVANSEHGVNGLAVGPDGLLYVSVGHTEALWEQPEFFDEPLDRPNADYLGTVLTYSPQDGRVEVFARGLRNVYGLAFGPDGALYGVDNDGPTVEGWRREEVLHIQQGGHYGYPHDDSFFPFDSRDDGALWHLDLVGSAGVAWVEDAGLDPGLLVGTCGQLAHVGLTDLGDEGMRVDSPQDVRHLLQVPGCITVVEEGPGSELLLGVFGWRDDPALYVVQVD